MRTLWVINVALLLSMFCSAQAWAHASAGIDSIDVIRSAEGSRIGVETTVGYLRSSDGEKYEWICHETVTQGDAVITPRYTESAQGVVLVTVGDLAQAKITNESMYRSEDGCDWIPPTGLTGHQIEDVAFDPADGMNVIAVTANDDGENHVFRSVDAGLTWSETDLVVDDRVFRTIRFARGPANAVWVTAVRHETEEAWIYRSTDGGVSFSEHSVEVRSAGEMDVFVDVLVADAEDPDIAWVVMGPYWDDRLLKTIDGGESFSEVYAIDGDIIDGTQDADGGIWLVLNGGRVVYGPEDDDFERVESVPQTRGIQAGAEKIYLATRFLVAGTVMATSVDGETFDAVSVFLATTGPPICSLESDSVRTCAPIWWDLWEKFSPQDEGDTAEGDTAQSHPPFADTGCCSGNAKHSSVGLVFVTLLGIGRRRRHGVES